MTPQHILAVCGHAACVNCLHSVRRLALVLVGGLLMLVLAGCGALTQVAAAPTATASPGARFTAASHTTVDLTQTQAGLHVPLKVDPAAYGPNQFGVILTTATTRQSLDGVQIQLLCRMLDMNMGITRIDLQPQGAGFYVGPSDLAMGGRWQVEVHMHLPSEPGHLVSFTFQFLAAIWAGGP